MRLYSVLALLFLAQGYLFSEDEKPMCFKPGFSREFTVSDKQFEEAVQLLGDLVAIPSVSNPLSPDYSAEHLEKAADLIEGRLKKLELSVSRFRIDGAASYIFAETLMDQEKPTLLLYAHYDVQPVDREKWISDPFIMEEREGRLYGRGASDDKAGVVAIISALDVYLKSGHSFPFNIKLLFEGEEEYASLHLKDLLEKHSEVLKADALVVLDGINRDVNAGTLLSSTRGLVNIHLKVNALEKPIHSGLGCLAPDPAQALANLIYSLRNPRDIPGFLDDSATLNQDEKEMLSLSSQNEESYSNELGILKGGQLRGDSSISVYERIVTEPSISIVNMTCGQPNGGNSIQDSASCLIGIRVTPGQDPARIAEVVINYLQAQEVPYNLSMQLQLEMKGAWAWKADLSGPFSKKYQAALEENFPTFSVMPIGGALPLLREFQEVFPSIEIIVPGVEDPYTSAHSHNESQDVGIFRNSINTLISFFSQN